MPKNTVRMNLEMCRLRAAEHAVEVYYRKYFASMLKNEGVTDEIRDMCDADSFGGKFVEDLERVVNDVNDYSAGKVAKGEGRVFLLTINPDNEGTDPSKLVEALLDCYDLKLLDNAEGCVETTKNAFPRWHMHIAATSERPKSDVEKRIRLCCEKKLKMKFVVNFRYKVDAYNYVNGDKPPEKMDDVRFTRLKRTEFKIDDVYFQPAKSN